MVEVVVGWGVCMCCGDGCKKVTEHHMIPTRMKPKHNVKIPMCRDCHDDLHADDVKGVMGIAWKTCKLHKQSISSINHLTKAIEELKKLQEKKK